MVTHTIRMKEMPEDERPYEKCIRYGAASLTDVELFAVLLQTGTKGKSALDLSREILTDENGKISLKKFRQMDYKDFCRVKGIGPVKAVQLSSLNELTKRLSKMQYARQPRFTSPEEIASFFMEDLRHEQQENLILVMMNNKMELLGYKLMFKGTVNASLISPREIFLEALHKEAVYIVLLHNHPSGDPTPSNEDIQATRRVRESGKLLGIQLADHIVIGDGTYMSMKENTIL